MSTLTPNVKREYKNSRHLQFKNNGEGIILPNTYKYSMNKSFAMSFWLKNPQAGTLFCSFSQSQYNGLYVYMNTSYIIILAASDWRARNGCYAYVFHGMSSSNWHHIMISHEAGYGINNFKVYIDNDLKPMYYTYDNLTSDISYDPNTRVAIGDDDGLVSSTPRGTMLKDIVLVHSALTDKRRRNFLHNGGNFNNMKKNQELYRDIGGWYYFQNVTKIAHDGRVKDYSVSRRDAHVVNIDEQNIEETV